jgi:hypothetical protein
MARKYGKKAQSKVKRAMHERKRGTLRSGQSGKKVTSRKQAIAIGLSEARRAGGKVPSKRGGSKKKKKEEPISMLTKKNYTNLDWYLEIQVATSAFHTNNFNRLWIVVWEFDPIIVDSRDEMIFIVRSDCRVGTLCFEMRRICVGRGMDDDD